MFIVQLQRTNYNALSLRGAASKAATWQSPLTAALQLSIQEIAMSALPPRNDTKFLEFCERRLAALSPLRGDKFGFQRSDKLKFEKERRNLQRSELVVLLARIGLLFIGQIHKIVQTGVIVFRQDHQIVHGGHSLTAFIFRDGTLTNTGVHLNL